MQTAKLGVRHFLAYYDLETDRLYGRFTAHKTAKEFLSFLRWVRSRYPRAQKLHIVMDNYGPHITDTVLTVGRKSHNVRVYHLSSDQRLLALNRIRCQFTALRGTACTACRIIADHEEQQAAIESYLAWRNHARDVSITAWTEYRDEALQTRVAA